MAELLPPLKAQFFDLNGDPLSGGKINTYVAGTSTPKNTYIDEAETSANTNPVVLNSRGEASIFIAGGSYKFVVSDSDDNIIYTIDNISRPSTGATGASVLTGTGAPASGLGEDGDSYIDTTTQDVYSKASGSWSVSGTLLPVATQQTLTDDTTPDITGLTYDGDEVVEFYFKAVVLRNSLRQVTHSRVIFTNGQWDHSETSVGPDVGVTFNYDDAGGNVVQVAANVTNTGNDATLQWFIIEKTNIEA